VKVLTILGARPQFIKAGSVSRELLKRKENDENIEEVIVHTGQHYDKNMSDIFFEEMRIPKPKYMLGIGGCSHGEMTGQMIEKIESIILEEQPDVVLVYGDTNSTLAGAIAASKINVRIAHVEAGLRSFNMNMPEEINRILTDRVSSILFCPTTQALENLNAEGVGKWGAQVVLSGDVMQDSAKFYRNYSRSLPTINLQGDFVLCTIHRAENTDDDNRLKSIVSGVNSISEFRQVVLPLHPRTRKKIEGLGEVRLSAGIKVIDPVGYLNMIYLLDKCSLVMTDSGGLQKEAFFFGKPCVTLRNETEWIELVENEFNVLVGSDYTKIVSAVNDYEFSDDYSMDLYGGGEASVKIVDKLISMA